MDSSPGKQSVRTIQIWIYEGSFLCSVHLPDRRGGVRGLCRHLPPRRLLPLHAGHDAVPEVGSALWAWMVVFSKSVVLTLRR